MAKLRKVSVIPSLLTLANGVCGFASVIMASRIHHDAMREGALGHADAMTFLGWAGGLIFLGMFFDVLDGRFARMANAASKFGAELDSLCDVVTFGVAPAFLLLKLGPRPENPLLYKVLFVASTFFVICTILRLARFNVETGLEVESHRFFKGLPSPAAAGCIAAIAVMRDELRIYRTVIDNDAIMSVIRGVLPFGAIGLAILMVSTVPYPHLVNQSIRGKQPFAHLVQLLILIIVAFIVKELFLVLAFWGFAWLGPVRRYGRPKPKQEESMQPQELVS